MGNPEEGVRREFEALGLDYTKRGAIFDEGLEAIRQLWTKGSVTLHGEHFTYDDVVVLLRHRAGAADAGPDAAADLGRLQSRASRATRRPR